MLQLRQFNLQFTLVGTRPLGENIQNQTRAVQHPALQFLLQVALLAGTEGVIEHDNFSFMLLHLIRYFLQLATAHKGTRMRASRDP